MIRVICQWCGVFIEDKDGRGVSGTSHGICEDCETLPEEKQIEKYRQLLMTRVQPRCL